MDNLDDGMINFIIFYGVLTLIACGFVERRKGGLDLADVIGCVLFAYIIVPVGIIFALGRVQITGGKK